MTYTLLDEFKRTVGSLFDKIEYVTFAQSVYLDKDEVFNQMNVLSTDAEMLTSIVFWGKNFKVAVIEVADDDYSSNIHTEFKVISFSRPRKTKIYKPESITQTWFNDELKKSVPFKSKGQRDAERKENIERQKRREANERAKIEKEKTVYNELLSNSRKYKDMTPKPFDTWIGRGGGAYIFVTEDIIKDSIFGVSLRSEFKTILGDYLFKPIDYVGYAIIEDGHFSLLGREDIVTSSLNDIKVPYRRAFYEAMKNENLMFPVIGISAEELWKLDESIDEILEQIAKKLKKRK